MRAYFLALRQKVVAAAERGDSITEEVAASYGVGLIFVKKLRWEDAFYVTVSPPSFNAYSRKKITGI